MKRYKNFALALIFSMLVLAPASTASARAASFHPPQILALAGKQDACKGLGQVGGRCGSGQNRIGNVAKGIVNIISFIAGVIAVIMIIVSGIRFMTSNGDSSKVAAARTALVYALIGVAVAGLTQLLIRFVISFAANS